MRKREMNIRVLNEAVKYMGMKEIPGELHNQEIIKMFKDASGADIADDETPWCAAFVGAVLERSGIPSSGKLHARSYQTYGLPTDEKPCVGDIVVLWRESTKSWKGHVGFYMGQSETHVYMLGGNQGNQVCVAPYSKSRLLTIRKYS